MAEWQAWLGLVGIGFLLFDRMSGGFGWLFGRTNAEQSQKRDHEQLRKDFEEHAAEWKQWKENFNEASSRRNSELQRIIGHIELKSVEQGKDIETLKEDLNQRRYGNNQRTNYHD